MILQVNNKIIKNLLNCGPADEAEASPIEKGKEVNIENYTWKVHQYVIDVPMLWEVFTHSEKGNRETEPRYLQAEKHY